MSNPAARPLLNSGDRALKRSATATMNSRQLAMKAIEKGALQKIAEFSQLISLLKRRKLHTIVEIGTAKGGTLYTWCALAEPDACLVSIDLPGGKFGGGYSMEDAQKFRHYKRPR